MWRKKKENTDLLMTPRPFRFRAEAAIPAARPGASSAGYTSDDVPRSDGLENSAQWVVRIQAAGSRSKLLENKKTSQ